MTFVAALAVYEYAITFEREVDTVWKRKLNWTSMFLLAIRYTTLLDAILQASFLLASGKVSEWSPKRDVELEHLN